MRSLRRTLQAAALALLPALPAAAQTGLLPQALPPGLAPLTADWRVSIGAGLLFAPDYLGSNDWKLAPIAAPDLRWRDNALFLSLRDGFGATLLREGNVTAGLLLRPRFGRDQDDNAALAGMGDIGISGEGGGFLSYDNRTWRGSVELRQGFGGHSGLLADLRVDRSFRLRDNLILSAGPRVSWGNGDFAETWFGVDPGQSARSGYQVFRPDSYWFAAGAGSIVWLIDERWSASLFGEVGQIIGDSADSPLVERGSATQGVIGFALAWRWLP